MYNINPQITAQTRLGDLLAQAETFDQYKADYRGKPGEFVVTDEGTLTQANAPLTLGLSAKMTPVTFTRHALKQASEKLGLAYDLPSLPTEYLNTLQDKAPALFAANMNGAIDRLQNSKNWLVRTYDNECRAVLSGEYLKFDSSEMLRLLNDVLTQDGGEHEISKRSYVTPDNMVTDVIFRNIFTNPDEDRRGNGGWGIGIRIRNGEIGNWTGGVYPLVKRHSCDNSITVDDRVNSFVFKHYGQNTAEFKRIGLHAAIGNILPFTMDIIKKVIAAEEKELPKFSDVVNGLAYEFGWSEEIKGSVFAGSEARYSLAGLVNGLTYAAHNVQMQPESMTDMEFLAGKILFDPKDSIIRQAIATNNAQTIRLERKEAREARKAERASARLNQQ